MSINISQHLMVYHILMYYITTFWCQMSSSSLCEYSHNHNTCGKSGSYRPCPCRRFVTLCKPAPYRNSLTYLCPSRYAHRFHKILRDRRVPAWNPLCVLLDKLHNTVVVALLSVADATVAAAD